MVQYAEDRSCITQFELGELFQKSQEKARDYKQAFKWYQLAAINGSRQAQHRLGTLYARGQGVKRNLVKAYAWCKVAAFQNSSRGKRKIKVLESKMEFNQIRKGRWLAQKYYDRFFAPRKQSARSVSSTTQCQ
jgi:TPR repeat protein